MSINKFILLPCLCLIFSYKNVAALDCDQNSYGQQRMNMCAIKELKEEEKKLDVIYKDYIKFLDEKDYLINEKKYFKESHIAWIKYKDSYCKFISSKCEGGSMCAMVWANCHTEKTIQRRKEIEEVYEYEKRL